MASGLVTPRRLSEAAIVALDSGNVDELLRINRGEFGGFVMMADDDDDDKDDDVDDAGSDGEGDADSDKSKSDKDEDDSRESGDDLEKMRKRMRAADQRADAAEKRLKEIEDAKKDDLTKAQDEVTELTEKVEKLQIEVRSLRLNNAFLSANKHSWHDAEVALSLADSKGYLEDVMSEDGDVDKKALGKALDRLATEHKYLVATDEKKDDTPSGPSGESAGRRSDNSKDDKAQKQQLRARFPVLQHR